MAAIRRPFTKQEWESVKRALPASLKTIMDEIEYVHPNCWNCENYEGFEGTPGKCKLHGVDIPNDQRGKDQDCFEMRVTPF